MFKGLLVGVVVALTGFAATAHAQLSSEPFQFSRGGGFSSGAGMSSAYREAIIDEQLTGARPEFFVTGPNGALVDVIDGGNGLAIPRTRTSTVITGGINRGLRGFRLSRGTTSAGGYGVIPDPAASVTAWTAMASGLPVPPQRWILRGHQPSPINAWVAQALALSVTSPN